jgi:Uma2 family endonuclease
MASVAQVVTAQQLFEMPGHRHLELIRGELVPLSPPGFDHGYIASGIDTALRAFVNANRLGAVVIEAGFCIAHDPDTVRGPDVAFVRAERIPAGGVRGFFQGPPDLAVEVVSPADRSSEVTAKAQQWIQSGCAAVWVVDPETKTVTVYSKGPQTLFLSVDDTLVCEELLPGFRLPVAQVFAPQG